MFWHRWGDLQAPILTKEMLVVNSCRREIHSSFEHVAFGRIYEFQWVAVPMCTFRQFYVYLVSYFRK